MAVQKIKDLYEHLVINYLFIRNSTEMLIDLLSVWSENFYFTFYLCLYMVYVCIFIYYYSPDYRIFVAEINLVHTHPTFLNDRLASGGPISLPPPPLIHHTHKLQLPTHNVEWKEKKKGRRMKDLWMAWINSIIEIK